MSFLLDTNIVSELRRGSKSHPDVWRWYEATPLEKIFLSVLVLGELRHGIERKRRKDPATARIYEKWLGEVAVVHRERTLSITLEICDIWGGLGATAQLSPIDGLIAATAIHYGLIVATRNESDFQRIGVDYFNPFTGGKP